MFFRCLYYMQDAWEYINVDPYPASPIEEPSDDIEINGP